MRNVRVWYKKDGACRFISHLDINRTISRALQMSDIPLWHTEGYNSRLYVSFALPLSLGFRGTYESVDIRILDDDYPLSEVIAQFNKYTPEGLTAYDISEPVMKPAAICFARFTVLLTCEEIVPEELYRYAADVLNSEHILAEKTTKKGEVKQIDLKENIVKYNIEYDEQKVVFETILPAGSLKNVNPMLLAEAIEKKCGCELFADITRHELYTENFEHFK